ncbi:MAG: hypothetical protein EXR83_07250 [Gammaproteobacteria bacterium]|nr:hypothetical protein [Gammaproteobacteria bacterium]
MIRRALQGGFALVSAVFLVVIVALMAGYAVSIGTSQQADATLSLLGDRAEFAAQSGLEWAVARVATDSACPLAGTSFSATGSGLDNFTLAVSCTSTSVTEGSITYPVYALTVTASRGVQSTEDYVQRVVTAQVTP